MIDLSLQDSSSFFRSFGTVSKIHLALNQKKISVRELVQSTLQSARSSSIGAYITLCEEKTLRQAQEADRFLSQKGTVPQSLKPLFGIPIAIKDLIITEGIRTTCGSKILENYIPPYTATAVKRLEEAGAILIGKTNLDEFGMGSSNENSAFGPVRHPTHPDRVAGGSSGGSAAAVKAGLCLAALGTDTGGSIRLPASYCGVVGLKPTYGRISRWGQVAYASSLDQMGPLANSVEDAALLLDLMSGHDPLDSTSHQGLPTRSFQSLQSLPDWSQVRIGIPQEYFVGGLHPDVEKAIQNSLNWFKKKGAQFKEISLPHTRYSVAVYYLVAVSEASSNLARYDGIRYGARPLEASGAHDLDEFYRKVRGQFGEEVKRRILLGSFALSSGYSDAYYRRACQVRRLIQQDFNQAFQAVDLILGPVSPTTAFRLGEKIDDPLKMYLNDIFTIPVNLAGLPALSLPCGKDQDGLPIGMHWIAPPFQEERLLTLAHSFFQNYEFEGSSHAS